MTWRLPSDINSLSGLWDSCIDNFCWFWMDENHAHKRKNEQNHRKVSRLSENRRYSPFCPDGLYRDETASATLIHGCRSGLQLAATAIPVTSPAMALSTVKVTNL